MIITSVTWVNLTRVIELFYFAVTENIVRINSKTRGDETEITIIHDLITAGYGVAIPFGDNDPYDIIVDNDGELYRVQCKTAWQTNTGRIRPSLTAAIAVLSVARRSRRCQRRCTSPLGVAGRKAPGRLPVGGM